MDVDIVLNKLYSVVPFGVVLSSYGVPDKGLGLGRVRREGLAGFEGVGEYFEVTRRLLC